MGAVALVHNHHGDLHVTVHKVYLEVCPYRLPYLTPLHQACQRPGLFWEVHVVCDGFRWGVGGLTGNAVADDVWHLLVCCQRTCHQVRCQVRAPDTQFMVGLVGWSLPCHISPVFRIRVPVENVAGLAHHYHFILNISLQVYPVK